MRAETAWYVCTREISAPAAAHAIRDHWLIENALHHVRDVVMGEDASRIRRQPGVFAQLRTWSLNLLRQAGHHNIKAARLAKSSPGLNMPCSTSSGVRSVEQPWVGVAAAGVAMIGASPLIAGAAVVGMGVAAVGGLAYAYDHYVPEVAQSRWAPPMIALFHFIPNIQGRMAIIESNGKVGFNMLYPIVGNDLISIRTIPYEPLLRKLQFMAWIATAILLVQAIILFDLFFNETIFEVSGALSFGLICIQFITFARHSENLSIGPDTVVSLSPVVFLLEWFALNGSIGLMNINLVWHDAELSGRPIQLICTVVGLLFIANGLFPTLLHIYLKSKGYRHFKERR